MKIESTPGLYLLELTQLTYLTTYLTYLCCVLAETFYANSLSLLINQNGGGVGRRW